MLRTIRTARNRLVIKAFKGDTTDPGSITAGWADIAAYSRSAAGRAILRYYDPYARNPVVLTTLEGLSGGFADCRESKVNEFHLSIRDTAGTATDGKLNVVTLGWEVDERDFVEPKPENLLRYSEAFANTYWFPTRITALDDQTVSPDGTSNASSVLETAATGTHNISFPSIPQIEPIKPGQSYRSSIFVKAINRRYLRFQVSLFSSFIDASSNATMYVQFDNNDGSTSVVSDNADGKLTIDSHYAESIGNGWYKLSLTFTSKVSHTFGSPLALVFQDDAAATSYLGDITKGWYVWGAQLSQARNPDVYVKTTDKPVTPFLTNSPVEQKVKASWASPRILPIRYSASTPTLEEGKFLCSLTAVATGRVKLTFKNAFAQTPIVIATTRTSGNTIDVEEVTSQYVILRQTDHAGTANDGGAHVLVFGSDSANGLGRARKSAKCPQIAPRLIAATARRIGYAGTANLNLQTEQCSDLGTVTRTATGTYVFVFQKPFRRTPVVVANALHSSWTTTGAGAAITAVSTTGFTVACTNTNNSAIDPSLVHVAVLGFDNAQEV